MKKGKPTTKKKKTKAKTPKAKTKRRSLGNKLWRFAWKTTALLVGLSLFFVLLFKWLPVPVTPLMVIRCFEQKAEGKPLQMKHDWVPMSDISKNLQLAVICSEDQNFPNHHGFDFDAIERAVDASKGGKKRLRGASTISQQTAKNVFLWPQRSWLRKGMEAYFTFLIEKTWGKKRILEVYLNSIEMGDGIYGAEAAAKTYFNKQAKYLSPREAAAITAILPSPRKYKAVSSGPYVQERIEWITNQMQQWGTLSWK